MRSNLRDLHSCRICGVKTFRKKGFCRECEAGLGVRRVVKGSVKRKAGVWNAVFWGRRGRKMKRNAYSFPEVKKEAKKT